MLEVTILSVLQGIAEFLPISSSGHLVLGKSLLGLGDAGIRLDVFLHVGTLFAVCAFYWRIIRRIALGAFGLCGESPREAWLYCAKIVVSAVPAAVVGILLKDRIEAAFASPKLVGAALVFTGFVLTATRLLPRGRDGVGFLHAIAMGIAQAIAILPGVSRSGMTLAAARWKKVDPEKAAEFSFLMSVPPIAGAALLEIADALKETVPAGSEVSWGLTIYGAAIAAVVGYVALALLLRSLRSDKFWLFGPYCVIAGIVTIFVAK